MYSFIDFETLDPNGIIYNDDNPPNRPSLYLEWHAIDGTVNQSGLGDIIGEDEDGDGDRDPDDDDDDGDGDDVDGEEERD